MKNGFIVFCLYLSSLAFSQEDDLPNAKERMNSYFDSKLERIQEAKDCVLVTETLAEVQLCNDKLEEKIEDHKNRIRENKNI